MKIVLTPLGVYVARIVGMVLAVSALAQGSPVAALAPLFAFLGLAMYRGDFRERGRIGGETTLRPVDALAAWPFWRNVAWIALVYVLMVGVGRSLGSDYMPRPIGWIAGMTILTIANADLRAFGLRTIRPL